MCFSAEVDNCPRPVLVPYHLYTDKQRASASSGTPPDYEHNRAYFVVEKVPAPILPFDKCHPGADGVLKSDTVQGEARRFASLPAKLLIVGR